MTEKHTDGELLSSRPATVKCFSPDPVNPVRLTFEPEQLLVVSGERRLSRPCRRAWGIHTHRLTREAERRKSETSLINLGHGPVHRMNGNNCLLSFFPQHTNPKSRLGLAACDRTSGSHRKQIKLSLLRFSYERYFCNPAL